VEIDQEIEAMLGAGGGIDEEINALLDPPSVVPGHDEQLEAVRRPLPQPAQPAPTLELSPPQREPIRMPVEPQGTAVGPIQQGRPTIDSIRAPEHDIPDADARAVEPLDPFRLRKYGTAERVPELAPYAGGRPVVGFAEPHYYDTMRELKMAGFLPFGEMENITPSRFNPGGVQEAKMVQSEHRRRAKARYKSITAATSAYFEDDPGARTILMDAIEAGEKPGIAAAYSLIRDRVRARLAEPDNRGKPWTTESRRDLANVARSALLHSVLASQPEGEEPGFFGKTLQSMKPLLDILGAPGRSAVQLKAAVTRSGGAEGNPFFEGDFDLANNGDAMVLAFAADILAPWAAAKGITLARAPAKKLFQATRGVPDDIAAARMSRMPDVAPGLMDDAVRTMFEMPDIADDLVDDIGVPRGSPTLSPKDVTQSQALLDEIDELKRNPLRLRKKQVRSEMAFRGALLSQMEAKALGILDDVPVGGVTSKEGIEAAVNLIEDIGVEARPKPRLGPTNPDPFAGSPDDLPIWTSESGQTLNPGIFLKEAFLGVRETTDDMMRAVVQTPTKDPSGVFRDILMRTAVRWFGDKEIIVGSPIFKTLLGSELAAAKYGFDFSRKMKTLTKALDNPAASKLRILNALDGEMDPKLLFGSERPLYQHIRVTLDDLWAKHLKSIGKNVDAPKRVRDYFPHVFGGWKGRGGHYVPSPVNRRLPRSTSNRFLQYRTGAEGYITDLDEALGVYMTTMIHTVHVNEALRGIHPVIYGKMKTIASGVGKSASGKAYKFATLDDIAKLDEIPWTVRDGNRMRIVQHADAPGIEFQLNRNPETGAISLTQLNLAEGQEPLKTFIKPFSPTTSGGNVSKKAGRIMFRQGGLSQAPWRQGQAESLVNHVLGKKGYLGRAADRFVSTIDRTIGRFLYQTTLGHFNLSTALNNLVGGHYMVIADAGLPWYMQALAIQSGRATGISSGLMKEAREFLGSIQGYIGSQGLYRELRNTLGRGSGRGVLGKVSRGLESAEEAAIFPFALAEGGNRSTAALAYWLKGKAAGLAKSDLTLYALDGVGKSQFWYLLTTQPDILKLPGIRNLAFLGSYPMRYLSHVMKDVYQAVDKTASHAVRVNAVRRVAKKVVYAGTAHWLGGSVLGQDWSNILGEEVELPGSLGRTFIPGLQTPSASAPPTQVATAFVDALRASWQGDRYAFAKAFEKNRHLLTNYVIPVGKIEDYFRIEEGGFVREFAPSTQAIFGVGPGERGRDLSREEVLRTHLLPGSPVVVRERGRSVGEGYDIEQQTQSRRESIRRQIRDALREKDFEKARSLAKMSFQDGLGRFDLSKERRAMIERDRMPLHVAKIIDGSPGARAEKLLNASKKGLFSADEYARVFLMAFPDRSRDTSAWRNLPVPVRRALLAELKRLRGE
jgi:hypothetical protein